MVSDSSHMESVDRWALYVKTHDDWKRVHSEFINAQFDKALSFWGRLAQTKEGRRKIIDRFGIKNKDDFAFLFQ